MKSRNVCLGHRSSPSFAWFKILLQKMSNCCKYFLTRKRYLLDLSTFFWNLFLKFICSCPLAFRASKHIPKGCGTTRKILREYKEQILLWSKPWKSSSFQLIYSAFMNLRVFQGGWHFTHLKKLGMWQGKGRRNKSKGLAIFQMQCIFLLFFPPEILERLLTF